MAKPFFMVSLDLRLRQLVSLAKMRGLPLLRMDQGYLIHSVLGELFGELAPRPFAIRGQRGGRLSVLGYADWPAEILRETADAVAEPAVHSCCEWQNLVDKRMPATWPVGTRFRFAVRVCPVVRRSGIGPNAERSGREMDAYLAEIEKNPGVELNRADVYSNWLRAAFERRGGAEIEKATLRGFSLRRLLRRDQNRKPRNVPAKPHSRGNASGRPDVTMEGQLRVSDSDTFGRLLRRGVGRHRAFGFGMILLRAKE